MEIIRYKTNIATERGLKKIAPLLNQAIGPVNWQLDLSSEDKVLTVFSPAFIREEQVTAAFRNAGYRAINLDDFYAIY